MFVKLFFINIIFLKKNIIFLLDKCNNNLKYFKKIIGILKISYNHLMKNLKCKISI